MPYSCKEFIWNSGLLSRIARLNISSIEGQNNLVADGADRLVLLGTQGGPFIHSYNQTPSTNLIVYKGIPIIIDTGFGVTFKLLDAGINLSLIKYIFITHHHSYHNLELGPLLYNARISELKEPIHVYAPAGLKSLLSFYWQANQFDIETRIKDEERPDIRELIILHEFSEGMIISNSEFEVTGMKNIHPPVRENYVFKFKLGNNSVVFSGDTAYCPALAPFASNADYLVHEVMYVPAVEEMVKRCPNTILKESILSHHTSTANVDRIASPAKVKNLVLTHFVPSDDKSLTEKVWLNSVKTTFSRNIIVGKDLLQFPF